MIKNFVVLALTVLTFFSFNIAEAAGCRCGRSYISTLKVCHKCVCGCPYCDYRDCAVPQMSLEKKEKPWYDFESYWRSELDTNLKVE